MIAEAAQEVEISQHAKEHQFIYDGERNPEDNMDQQIIADSGIKFTSVGETVPTRSEFLEECAGDDAGFASPIVKSATDAVNSVVDEESISLGKIPNDSGDFACDGNDDDDFGGFASFGEAIPSTTEHKEEGPNNFEPTDARSDEEEADIGGRASFEDQSSLASTDVQDKNDVDTPSNEDQSSVQNERGSVASFGDGFSYSEDSKHQNQTKPGSGDDDDFGDFGDFEEVRTAPINQSEKEEVAQGENQPQRATMVSSMNDDNFGDFGDFEEVPPTFMNENETEQVAQAENQPEPAMGISSMDDEDFGDFGSFEEVSSKPINQHDIENSSTAGVSKQINQDPGKQQEMDTGISPFGDDDFGDFEEVSSTITDQMQDGKTSESLTIDVPTPPVTVLDESVRVMFQTVFAADGQVQLDLDVKESPELPFDVSLRSVLVSHMTVSFFSCIFVALIRCHSLA
jgi:hypothetical protein